MRLSARTVAQVAVLVLMTERAGLAQPQATPVVPDVVTLQVSVTRQGEGKVNVQPYSIDLPTGGITTSLRLGSEVPVTLDGKTFFQQVGAQIDAQVSPDGAGRFKLQLTITLRLAMEEPPKVPNISQSQSAFRNFIAAGTYLLKLGETSQTVATDLLTNETWQTDVTLSAKKQAPQ